MTVLLGRRACTTTARLLLVRSSCRNNKHVSIGSVSFHRRRVLTTDEGAASSSLRDKTGALPVITAANLHKQNETSSNRTAAIALASLCIGFAAGRIGSSSHDHDEHDRRVLPDGLPRACCCEESLESKLTPAQKALPATLAKLVGADNVLDGSVETTRTLPFLKGARLGGGAALAIVTPRRLVDAIDAAEAIVNAGCIVLPQGSNTGLTGGSVPHCGAGGGAESRPTVVLSMKYLDRIFPIDDGNRVVCLAGVGLASLTQFLAQYFPHRESHSQLGSTFLNPTAAAGVALGSGGTQLRKGPAYTERALYLKMGTNKWNENVVEIVNTLGIDCMCDKDLPKEKARKHMDSAAYRLDTWSRWIQDGRVNDMRYSSTTDPNGKAAASDVHYKQRVCQPNDSSVSRYNADTRGPDLNRSEGKVLILATVHDTFPKPKITKTFWIGFDSLETALLFRRVVCLDNPIDLPVSLEYLDRDAVDVIDRSGRAMAICISWFGTTSSVLRNFWNVKLWIEALPLPGAALIVDQFLHKINPMLPFVLPNDVQETALSMDHHVTMTVGDFGDDDGVAVDGNKNNMERLLDRLQKFAATHGRDKIVIHDCTKNVAALNAFRFVAAPAFKTWCVGQGAQGISVDYALPKNGGAAPPLDASSHDAAIPIKRMRYSHFGCNVVHEDLAYRPECDVHKAKHDFKAVVEFQCGGKLPAEHGHGTEYVAPKATQDRWKKMDPLNVLNPGVGGLSEKPKYIG